MDHAGWIDVWHLAIVLVTRQAPFAQIVIASGAVLFVVMAIEGMRTSMLAMRRAAISVLPQAPREASWLPMTATAAPSPVSRLYAAKPSPRPLRKPKRRAVPAATRLRPAIRRYPKLEQGEFCDTAPAFSAFSRTHDLASV